MMNTYADGGRFGSNKKVRQRFRSVSMNRTAARLALCCAMALASPLMVSRATAEPGAETTRLKWRDRQASVVVEPAVGELRRYDFTAGIGCRYFVNEADHVEASDRPYPANRQYYV
jgi:hypothetical protein